MFCCMAGKAGIKTLLLEKKKFPRDKYCGDAVCKTAIEILDEMGLYEDLVATNKARVVRRCPIYTQFKVSLKYSCLEQ